MIRICHCLTMRMNGDQERRAGKFVAVPSSFVAPALPGALCAALGGLVKVGVKMANHSKPRFDCPECHTNLELMEHALGCSRFLPENPSAILDDCADCLSVFDCRDCYKNKPTPPNKGLHRDHNRQAKKLVG